MLVRVLLLLGLLPRAPSEEAPEGSVRNQVKNRHATVFSTPKDVKLALESVYVQAPLEMCEALSDEERTSWVEWCLDRLESGVRETLESWSAELESVSRMGGV